MANTNIKWQDPTTGIYQDIDNTYYLNNGTPIDDFDLRTGAYMESDGTWYTFQGVPLMDYNKDTGAYQEDDGTWYESNGTEVLVGSSTYGFLKGAGYDLSQNVNTVVKKPISPHSIQSTTVTNKTAQSPQKTPSWLLPTLLLVGAALVGTIVYYTIKKK